MIIHKRAVGDILSPIPFQIKKNGVIVNLTGREVKFAMYDNDGIVIIPRTAVGVTVTNAINGEGEYDFQNAALPDHTDVDDYPDGRPYYAYIYVYDADPGVEPDQYPPGGFQIVFFSPQRDQNVEPVIDIAAAAQAPKRSRTEEGSVEERSIDELIKADQYLKGQAVPDTVPWGIRMARIRYGSTTPGSTHTPQD